MIKYSLCIIAIISILLLSNYFIAPILKSKDTDYTNPEQSTTQPSKTNNASTKKMSTNGSKSDYWSKIKETVLIGEDQEKGYKAEIPQSVRNLENKTIELNGVAMMVPAGTKDKKVNGFLLVPFSNTTICCGKVKIRPVQAERILYVHCPDNTWDEPESTWSIVKCTGTFTIEKPNPSKLIYQLQDSKVEVLSHDKADLIKILQGMPNNICEK